MADIISRLKLESGEFDSKIKRAGQELMAYSEHCRKTGLQMGFANKDAREFAQSLGSMQTTSTTARGKINELSDAFVNLRMMYKQMTDEEKNNQFGKNLAASLDQLKTRIMDAKKELADVTAELNGASSGGKGGFFDGLGSKMDGALAVFGGNLLTKGVTMLTSELAGSVQQSIELAKQGEGVRMAFERLNQPGLLDNLKAATHGTVSEVELMKQAIKFENFKLPVEALANYLAFAQQKAKDTGESIDFLVTSIVNGLGRQSKQILDNLGISAAELTQRMNEGATMTEAVSAIIKEEMAKAGDYVETAADRAARATADTQNKMEELGRSAMPVAEEFASAWAEIRNGAMTLVLPVLSSVADSIRDIREILGGEWDMPKLKPGIPNLAEGPAESNQPKRPTWGDVPVVKAPGGYVEVTDQSGKVLHGGHYDSDAQLQNMMKRWNTLTTPTRTSGSRPTAKKEQTEMQQNQTRINELTQQYVTLMAAASEAGKPLTDEQQKQTSEIQRHISELEKRNGQLKLYQEQAQGKLLGPDAFRQQLSVDVAVNNKKIEELEKQLLSLNGITIDPKTVTITATDEALPKLREIQGVTIDPKTVTITATDEALPKLREIQGITIDPKTVTITATDEALQKLLEIDGITINDKTVAITADDKTQPEFREIEGIRLKGKKVTVTAATMEAMRAVQGINGVTIDPKTVTITATDDALPKLREIQGITVDDKTMTVTAQTADALRALQGIDGVTINPKTVTITATDDALPKLREIQGITIDDKTMTVTAETADALRALQGINGVTIDPKTVTITATDEALPKLREIEGITIDDKTMTVTADTQEALQALQGIDGVTVDTKTVKVTAETDEARQKVEELKRQIAELKDQNLMINAGMASLDLQNARDLSRTGGVTGFVGTGKSMTTIEGLPSMSDVVRQRGGNLLDDKAMKAVNEDIGRNLPKDNETDKRDDPLKEAKKQNQYLEGIGSDISGMLSGLEKMGIEIPEGLSSVVGGIQMISGIVSSILALVGVISALTSVKSVPIFGWLLAQGGIAGGLGGRHPIHAAGGTVVGNTYSGDQIPAMLNAGEVVLNRAQQGNIASQLESGASQNLKLDAVITGEQIRMVLNNNGRRTGRGEYVTSNRR